MNNEIKLGKLNKAEALRYMGVRSQKPDYKLDEIMDRCEEDIFNYAKPRYVYRVFDFKIEKNFVSFDQTNLILPGNSITEHLRGCDKAVAMAVTISGDIDKMLRIYQFSDMTKAVVADSLASVAVEQVCDKVETIIREEYNQYYQTFRFGIGYGDLPISCQRDFLNVLNAPKLIGLNVNESFMLTPTKSVTAVIGLSKEQIKSRKKGCATCNMRDNCKFRATGGRCSE
ncbi:MAG: vitamin B12 dependent-methionine synthase activation domain-containing protein [Lachnospira sp.]